MGLAYDIRYVNGRNVARMICHSCPAHDEITAPTPNNPEFVAKKFREKGWECDGFSASRNRCPACAAPKKKTTLADMTTAIKPKEPTVTSAAPKPVRDATNDERARIRRMLDKHFDDARGCYLDGYSDQKIGGELNIPWALVTKVREAAYGPILTDPEVESLRADLAAAKKLIDDRVADLTTLRSEVSRMETRVNDLARRLASR